MKPVIELWTPVLINGGIFKDDYVVSNMGRVKRKHRLKNGGFRYFLVNVINGTRPMVRIKGGGKLYSKSLAKLVLSSFHYREGCECAHITYLDGDRNNCRLSNLRYTVDKDVYTGDMLDQKPVAVKHKTVMAEKPKQKKSTGKPVKSVKSCSTCTNTSCAIDLSNFSTDFGAEGCRQYQ